MLFYSISFFIFLTFFLPGFILLKGRARIFFTLLGSYVFYSWWYPPYIILILGLTLFGYFAGRSQLSSAKKFALILTVLFLPLVFFKYTNFFLTNLEKVFGFETTFRGHWQLPLGISFITFTVVAYLMDIRRKKAMPEKDLSKFALYIAFFPHLIAGPIMRPHELLPQLSHLKFKSKLLRMGLLLFAVGMVKKVVFADTIAPIVDAYYRLDAPCTLAHSLFAFYGFAIQIYCDFSGYTDMALGIAFILGVRLPLNFNRPYAADSIRNFWRRWHITLSRWLRDYLYIPLGGSRHGYPRMITALLITMTLGGLWHGAAWTFVVWGLLHGIFQIIEHIGHTLLKNKTPLPCWLKQVWTFHAVAVAWIFFRARSWEEAQKIFHGFTVLEDWSPVLSANIFPISLIAIYFLVQRWDRVSFVAWTSKKAPAAAVYAVAIVFILMSIAMSVGNPSAFIYFDF